MEPFSFTARDGLTIHGYATFPPGAGRSGLPAVLNVHGGPWARECWGFDPEAQWLANRGYLGIQVNYRGSTGYGKAFVNAGDREWGGKMQDDLSDAVAFVVGQGWADPKRVAIYGGSYGGYAALAGAAFTPDLFCCAVDIVALEPEDPDRDDPAVLGADGGPVPPPGGQSRDGADFLWSRSPLSRAGSIRIPCSSRRAPTTRASSRPSPSRSSRPCRAAGVDHEYLLFPDEGHGFAKPENRLRFYAVADRFLARYLGGRTAADVAD